MPTILVCDDTPDIVEMLQFILEGEGYAVTTASAGQEVMGAIETNRPDLVLLDLRMPGLDGFGVLREFRLRPGQTPPVIVLSAKGMDEDRRAAISAGARDYLVKPFTVGQLLTAVRKQLDGAG